MNLPTETVMAFYDELEKIAAKAPGAQIWQRLGPSNSRYTGRGGLSGPVRNREIARAFAPEGTEPVKVVSKRGRERARSIYKKRFKRA